MLQNRTRSAPRSGSTTKNRARLALEPLEMRYCLSCYETFSASPVLDSQVAQLETSSPPVISGFQATHSGNYWTFSGTVIDQNPAGLTVTFGGLPSLQGRVATTNGSGSFSLTVQLQPGEGGTATAQTTDWAGQQSNLASVDVVQPGPGGSD
jgi:hypothetical protein